MAKKHPGWPGDSERHRLARLRTPQERMRRDDILQRIAQGETVSALAAEHGISKQAIYLMLKNAGQPPPTEVEQKAERHHASGQRTLAQTERMAAILMRLSKGEEVRALAREYGISRQAIYLLIKETGGLTPTEREQRATWDSG